MKIAVTGASGFIGRHVLQELSTRESVEVTATSRTPMDVGNLTGSVRHVTLDIESATRSDYERLGRPDVLIHLAWSGLPHYRSLHHFETELPRQFAFLQLMVESGLPALLVAGTCYEYGMASGELLETMIGVPSNPYAFAKTALRQQLEFLQKERNFALTWARLFYTYGAGQPATSLYPQLAAAVARGDTHFKMSRGEQLRDYLPVVAVARHLVDLAVSCPGAGVVNICSGEPVSVRALVEQWLVQKGWHIALDLGKYPYPDYEPLAFWGSAGKLHSSTIPRSDRSAD